MLGGKFRLLVVLTLLVAARAQGPDAPFRVTVNLVQVDAVVTDGSGRHVTDLKLADFEVLQDGRPQKLTNCAYVSTGPAKIVAPATAPQGPLPPPRLAREQVHRTIAVVVDDLGLYLENVLPIRLALKKFIDEQVQPGDMVAILRTGGNIGALQQFTSDKAKLYSAIERVQWYWQSRTGLTPDSLTKPIAGEAAGGTELDTIRRLTFVASGLRQLPGRKSIVLFAETDVIPLRPRGLAATDPTMAITRALDQFIDMASRASVAVYTIDVRGIGSGLAGLGAAPVGNDAAKESMRLLSRSTGGLFFGDLSSDLSVPLRKVLEDQQGYYLLGYSPDAYTFDPKTGRRFFHKITVRVKRPGLSVRSHAGFFGTQDEEKKPAPGSTSAVVASLASPFGSPDIEVGMTSLFFDEVKQGPSITTLVNVSARDLTFSEGTDGLQETAGDIAVMVFTDNGDLANKTAFTFRARLNAAQYQHALANGFLHTFRLPVKKAGPYDVRVAVRDAASRKVGTASQFVEVPELKRGKMALSGILLQTPLPAGQAVPPAVDLRGGTALRIFHPGETLTYGYQVLNPKLEAGTRKPNVEAQVRLYRDGKQFFEGKAAPVEAGFDGQRLLGGGELKIGPDLPPGDYVLETTATDLLAVKSNRTATRYIDFRVAP